MKRALPLLAVLLAACSTTPSNRYGGPPQAAAAQTSDAAPSEPGWRQGMGPGMGPGMEPGMGPGMGYGAGPGAMGPGMMSGPSGPPAGRPGLMQMDPEQMCALHDSIKGARSQEERQAMMNQLFQGMSPQMQEQHLQMMEQRCAQWRATR